MEFSSFDKPMYRVAFTAAREDFIRLLDFMRFVHEDGTREKLLKHRLGPSDTWKGWADETYIGFSTGRLMLQSGHRFGPAEHTHRQSRLPWRRDRSTPDTILQAFRNFYDFPIPAEHGALFDAHPGAYLRSAEAYLLSDMERPARMLEIGAGNAVHVAFRHLLNHDLRTTVIDLPESMNAGYLLLRLMDVDVALPHEDRPAAVTMRLPYQDMEGEFDFAFNMGSFQEMEIDVVNGYLGIVRERAAAVQLVNLKQSRQMPDTKTDNYDLSGFSVTRKATPYNSSLAKGLEFDCLLGVATA